MTRIRSLAEDPSGASFAGPAVPPRGSRGAAAKWVLAGSILGVSLFLACGNRLGKTPEWVLTAPAPTVMAVSGQAGWVLEEPHFQSLLERFPMAEQTLDLFLKRAKISPHQETGRVTFYVISAIPINDGGAGKPQAGDFLIQLGGFRNPGALHVAIADAFPSEGSLAVEGRELPLFVLFDLNQYHLRAVVDAEGRVWLGDLAALTKLGAGRLNSRNPVVQSAQWINGSAPFQGFLKPQGLLREASAKLPADWAKSLPQGIESMAWSVTPGPGPNGLHRFELAITGSPEGIQQVAPWLQRLVAAATGLQGGAAPAPELLQEARRIGLRAQLTQEQVNLALAKLSQPNIAFGQLPGAKRP